MKKTKEKPKAKPKFSMPTLAEKKAAFIKRLATYFATDQGKWSIRLEMGSEDAKTWASLRSYTPLMGYPSVEEAEKLLTEFLA